MSTPAPELHPFPLSRKLFLAVPCYEGQVPRNSASVVLSSGPQFPPMQPFPQGVPDGNGTVLKNDKASCAHAQCGLGLWPMLSLGVRVPAVTNNVISTMARTFVSLCSWKHLRAYAAPSVQTWGSWKGERKRGSEQRCWVTGQSAEGQHR